MAAVQYPPNPAPQHMVVQCQSGDNPDIYGVQNLHKSETYNSKSARITGWLQLSCAIACFVFGVVQLLVGSSLSMLGGGIWSGVLIFLPTGILGVRSQAKDRRVIVAYMVMSILSALVAFNVLSMGIVGAAVSHIIANDQNGEVQALFRSCTLVGGILSCGIGVVRARIAFDSLLALAGLFELVVAIVAAGNCCDGVCCGRTDSSAGGLMVYQMPAVMMTMPSYGQPVGVEGQPPPANQPQAENPVAYPQARTGSGPQPNCITQEQELEQEQELAQAPPGDSDVLPLLPEEEML